MLKLDNRLKSILEKLQGLMLSLKTLKNSAVLDAFTHLRPTLYVKTRWNGKYKVCQKFLKLHDALISMHEENDNPFTIQDDELLQRYTTMLGFMNLANEAIQAKGIKLFDAQMHLDNLIEQVEAGNKSSRGEGHWARGCQLGSTYIGRNSAKLVSKDFHNGVMKIQGGGTSQLTDDEKAAVATLRKDGKVAAKLKDDGSDSADEDDCEDGGVSLHDAAAQVPPEALRLAQLRYSPYLISSEKFLIPARSSTHPLLLEAILFLRFNETYWTQYTVTQATMMVRKDNSNKRYKKETRDSRSRMSPELGSYEIQKSQVT
jgi:hypothetical protein